MMLIEKSAKHFWSWFLEQADALRSSQITESLTKELNSAIRSLGIPSWELGPDPRGVLGSAYLCLSDNGDSQKVEIVTDVLSLAPVIKYWRFTRFRQRKEWNGVLEFESSGELVRMDCTKWRFGFSKTDRGILLDICIPDTGLKKLEYAAYVFILQEIGEEDFRNHFIDYDLELWSECGQNPFFMSFDEFRAHWNAVMAGTHIH